MTRFSFKTALLAAIFAPMAALDASPAMARPAYGYTLRDTRMLSGPQGNYPEVIVLAGGSRVTLYGCLRDRSWCDVSHRYDRGWVYGGDIEVDYRGHRDAVTAYLGLGVASFVFANYWYANYRTLPFYARRARWSQQGGGSPPDRGRHQAGAQAVREAPSRQPAAHFPQPTVRFHNPVGALPFHPGGPTMHRNAPAPRAPMIRAPRYRPTAGQSRIAPPAAYTPPHAAPPRPTMMGQHAAPGKASPGWAEQRGAPHDGEQPHEGALRRDH